MKKMLMLATVFCGAISLAAEEKMVPYIVNLEKLVRESKEGLAIGETLAKLRQDIMTKAQDMQKELTAENEMFQKQSALMSADKRVEKQQEMAKKDADFQRTLKAMQEDWQRDAQVKQEMFARKVVENAIEVCKKRGGKCLIDSRMAYWFDDSLDITNDSIKVADNKYSQELLAAAKEKENVA